MQIKNPASPVFSMLVASCALSCSAMGPQARKNEGASSYPGSLVLSEAGEKHRVSPEQPIRVGSGYNSITQEVAGDCMEVSSLTTLSDDHGAGGMKSAAPAGNDVVITYVDDYSRLGKELGVRVSAYARFFFRASISAEAEYASRSEFSENSSFLLAAATMRKETERLQRYRIKADALDLLNSNPRAFFRRCGDQFVAGRIKGASFTAIVEIRDTTEDTKSAIRGRIGAGLSFVGVDSAARVDKAKALELVLSRHELYYRIMSVGLPAYNPSNIDGFVDAALNLQKAIDGLPGNQETAIEFVTRSYDIADNFPARARLPSLTNQARILEHISALYQETSIVLNDLQRATRMRRACSDSEQRRQIIVENLKASNQRMKDRGYACVSDPEQMCNLAGLPDPMLEEARSWISECSNLEAFLLAKKVAAETTEMKRRLEAEAIQRTAAEDARRNRGRPGGLPCSTWLLSRVDAEVPDVRPEGDTWDDRPPPYSLPDLYLVVKVDKNSRKSGYESDSTLASFSMKPPIPVKAGAVLRLSAYDLDIKKNWWGGEYEDPQLAVAVEGQVPRYVPVSGFPLANARGAFTVFGECSE